MCLKDSEELNNFTAAAAPILKSAHYTAVL